VEFFDVELLPVRAINQVVQPFVVPIVETRHVGGWKYGQSTMPVVHRVVNAFENPLVSFEDVVFYEMRQFGERDGACPGHIESEFEGAASVHPLIVVV